MKKKISAILLALFLSIGFVQAQKIYESEWTDLEKEFNTFQIVKEQGEFWWQSSMYKSKITPVDNNYMVTLGENDFTLRIDNESGLLWLGKTKYIPKFKSYKVRFSGKWVSTDSKTHLMFNNKAGIVCDVSTPEVNSARFYPKVHPEGLTFTYGGQQMVFKLKDNKTMVDNNGTTYNKIGY